jgi:tetratricopeptide (TPR) repeat protein
MSKNAKIVAAVAVVALLVIGRYFAVHKSVKPLPSLSPRAGEVKPSSEFLNAKEAVEYYEYEIRRKPEVVQNYVELAQLFLQEARITGNHHEYIPKAQEMLEEALRREPENPEAMMAKASMLMTLHQFQEAKQLAQTAVERRPRTAMAWGLLSDALVELGEYEEAVTACDKMLSLRPDLRSYARASHLREIHGDGEGAVAAMRLACDAGVSGQENRAWALYHLGLLYLNQGKRDTAAYIFNGILEERPTYAYALSGLAQIDNAKKQYAEAIDLLTQAYQTMPEHAFFEQLVEVYRAAGDQHRADATAKKVLEAFGQHERGGWNINREYALFCADHDLNLPAALKRARMEYERRPKNIDVLETYAWALYKNGKAAEAISVIEQAMRLNTRRATLHYRAGMIYHAAAQPEKALACLKRSLHENLYLHPLHAESAQQAIAMLSSKIYALK